MSTEDQTLDLLAYHAFPKLAAAMRARSGVILRAWEAAVICTLPAADELTLKQLRNSIPKILEEIADALASDKPSVTRDLVEGSKVHGSARFDAHYNVRELVIEYRLLRRVILEQLTDELDASLSPDQNVAINMAIDTTIQSGLVAFTEQQRQQIQAGAELQSKYLAFLSHDLRNHLNHATLVLQFLGRRLAESPDFADSVEDVETIQKSIFQTTAGMDRLLQAERLRKETAPPRKDPVDLKKLLSDLTEQIAHEARSKGLTMNVDVPIGATAQSDKELLTLVLQNLLGNAVKYSSRGNVTMSAKNAPGEDGGDWVLGVSDEGPGIAPENLGRLFEAFTRGDTHGQAGVGLGLSIASQASRLLGAKLEIESQVGVGSTFRVRLPQAQPN